MQDSKARKAESDTRSKREAQRMQLLLEFLLPLQFSRVAVRVRARSLRPVLSPLSGGPTPEEREVAHGPPTSAAAHSGRQGESVPHSCSQARSQFRSPGHGPKVSVMVKWANQHMMT